MAPMSRAVLLVSLLHHRKNPHKVMLTRHILRHCGRLWPVPSFCTRSIHSDHRETALKRLSNENRELILSILKLTTTRRETKFYLEKYDQPETGPFRIILFKFRGNLQHYNTDELKKFGATLEFLKRLGASPMVLLDTEAITYDFTFDKVDKFMFDQFTHLTNCLSTKLTPLRSLLKTENSEVSLEVSHQLSNVLRNTHIPVIFPYVTDEHSKEWAMDSTTFIQQLIPQLHATNTTRVEKVVYIDNLGGPPSVERNSASHVFINLNQEFDRVCAELNIGHLSIWEREMHLKNLTSLKTILDSVEYPDLTGIITTLPIANEAVDMNPIIYNVLTDRALISSSLPAAKYAHRLSLKSKVSKTTIVRKGLQVREYKSLEDVDLVKFKSLIDDSFKRELDMDHYMKRIQNTLLKVIVVGDYDGIAVVTNESSNGVEVPYLDKFAISRHAQGSLGVADVIFNSLRRQFRKRLLWRSKKINPVNGWYFQRSNGSVSLDDSDFRIFWIGEGVTEEELKGYVDIGKKIVPSFTS